MRISMALLVLMTPTVLCAAAPNLSGSAAVAKWIDQLGSDDEEAVKSAQKKLTDLGMDAVPALRMASKKHADADVRLRALRLENTIYRKYWGLEKALGPGAALKSYPIGGGYWLNRVRFSKDGKLAIAAGGALIVYDIESGKEKGRVLEVRGARPGLDLSSSGQLALTSHSSANDFHLVELSSLKIAQRFSGHTKGVVAVSLAQDGKKAASASLDGTVRLWDVESGKETAKTTRTPTALAFSPDGKRLLIAGAEKDNLRLHDGESLKALKSLIGHAKSISAVRFLGDGKHAVSSDTDGKVILWDVESGKLVRSMDHGATVNDVAVSPDGGRALTAGFGDKKVKLWDLKTGKLIETFDGHLGAVLGVAFSADGKRGISSDVVCAVRVWKLGR